MEVLVETNSEMALLSGCREILESIGPILVLYHEDH